MIIELTTIDAATDRHMKELINAEHIYHVGSGDSGTVVYSSGGKWYVKESPAQIQEMILLDEFAKAALTGLCANPNFKVKEIESALGASCYRIAKAMIKARKGALG